jgi:antitoxin component YwqK of YwqJK toxin-antitoxin module
MEIKYYKNLNLTNYTGEYKTYYPNDKLQSKMCYKNGKIDGKYTCYFEDSERIWYTTNLKNGLRNGETVVYYTNGNIKEIANYVDNKLDGEVKKYWFDGGNLQERKKYILDSLIEANHYSTQGNLEFTQYFDEDGNMKVFEYSSTGVPREVHSKYDMTM